MNVETAVTEAGITAHIRHIEEELERQDTPVRTDTEKTTEFIHHWTTQDNTGTDRNS
jgi:hypothetical protein